MAARHGESPRYGMVVDINRCVGCQTCTISCKHVNDTPPGVQWRRVLDVERGVFPDVERLFLVVGCQHCAEPPCVPVCPTGATQQRADGLVTMDYDLCIGCGYCAVACPYQARTIVHQDDWYYGEPTQQEEAVRHEERIGVASKCTFCVEKIDNAPAMGRVPGVDLEATPACAASCITQAITFGDFNDPGSQVSQLLDANAHFQMHEELGTDPQIKYLYEVPVSTPGLEATSQDLSDEKQSDVENPLVGSRQTFWDFRAAANFALGGMSAGFAAIASIFYGMGFLSLPSTQGAFALAMLGMAVGLFAVFMEIGRKRRFLFVLLRPQSSWMTRETYAVALFYPAALLAVISPNVQWAEGAVFVAGVSAAAFLFCQARILYAGKGIPAWRASQVPWLICLTGLLEGVGCLAVIAAAKPNVLSGADSMASIGGVGATLSVLGLLAWCSYLEAAMSGGVPPLARGSLRRTDLWIRWGGYVLPAGAFIALCVPPITEAGQILLLILGGASAVVCGIALKISLVTRASYQQGYAIPRMPQRGSGNRAAPIRLDPGVVTVN